MVFANPTSAPVLSEAALEAQRDAIYEQIRFYGVKKAEIEAEIAALGEVNGDIAELTIARDGLTAECDMLTARLETLRSDVLVAKKTLDATEEKSIARTADFMTFDGKVLDLEKKSEELAGVIAQKTEDIVRLGEQKSALEEEIAVATDKRDSLLKQTLDIGVAAIEEKAALEATIAEIREKVTGAQSELDATNAYTETVREALADLNVEKVMTSTLVDSAKAEAERIVAEAKTASEAEESRIAAALKALDEREGTVSRREALLEEKRDSLRQVKTDLELVHNKPIDIVI